MPAAASKIPRTAPDFRTSAALLCDNPPLHTPDQRLARQRANMRFEISATGIGFEIPDDWWSFAEMDSFSPKGGGFYPYKQSDITEDIHVVLLSEIEPPMRNSGVPPFKKYKMVPVLLAFLSPECLLPPVEVQALASSKTHRFKVYNGYHRYYASVAVGYTKLPIVMHKPF